MACNCGYRKRIQDAKTSFDVKRTVYLDYNATTPVDPAVLGEFERVCRRVWANPSSLHSGGIEISETIDACTKTILDYCRLKSGKIYYCSSGSEAIHAGMFGLAQVLSREHSRKIISSNIEHSAVKLPLRIIKAHPALEKIQQKKPALFLKVDKNGRIDVSRLESVLAANGPALLVYSPVHHETGGIQPVREIYEAAGRYNCLVVLDAVQAFPRLSPEFWARYCDAFALSGHKLYAPKGIAALYIREGLRLHPYRFGGSQQDGIFPGTENTPGIAALARAVELLRQNFSEEQKRLQALIRDGFSILQRAGVEFVPESPDGHVPGSVCISFPWIRNMEDVMFTLDNNRICASRFSACTSRISGPSPVLQAMGRPANNCETSMRISLGRYSRREDFFKLAETLKKIKK